NALRFLFEREDIPPDVPKYIMMYCLDAYNSKGESGKNGTSKMAMQFLSGWLNQFSKLKKLSVASEYLSGDLASVTPHSSVVGALQQGGVAVVRVMYGCWHYVLLTGAEGGKVTMFDPYLRTIPFRKKGVEMLNDPTGRENRRVEMDHLNAEGKSIYALGEIKNREAVILFNTKSRKTPERTIEYFL
ncbi:MAG: peptidase C39, partial [Oscillospiraceae bacterium]|nr:peptidase C39 [Oscillospiraceae bacterium]